MAERPGLRVPVRRWVARAGGRTRRAAVALRARANRPTLSVVVAMYNVEAYVADCLTSVLGQTLSDLEVIVVDDGSTDRSAAVVARFADRDDRVRVVHQANTGQGPARNLGVRRARGRYLAFLDADDVLPAEAYADLVGQLTRSGSDFVVGPTTMLQPTGRHTDPSWTRLVFDRRRTAVTIDDAPEAMFDVLACNRVFRRRFWTRRVGGFPGGMAFEDHVPVVTAYLRAAAFDVWSAPIYFWRIRPDLSSTRQQKHELANLEDRVRVKTEARALLDAEASPAVRAAWNARVLDLDLLGYVEAARRSGGPYRDRVRALVADYLLPPDSPAWAYVRVAQKLKSFLAAAGEWEALHAAERYIRDHRQDLPTETEGTRVRLADEAVAAVGLDLPDHLRRLSDDETRLSACLRGVTRDDRGGLTLTGWAFVANLDHRGRRLGLTAALRNPDTGVRVPLAVTPVEDPQATRWSRQRRANVDGSGFRLHLGSAELGALASGRWQLWLERTVDEVRRSGPVRAVVAGSSAGAGALTVVRLPDGRQVSSSLDPELGFALRVAPVGFRALALPTLVGTGDLQGALAADRRPEEVRLRRPSTGETTAFPVEPQGPGRFAFRAAVPLPAPGVIARFDLLVADRDGTEHPLSWPDGEPGDGKAVGGLAGAAWRPRPDGGVTLELGRPVLDAVAVRVTGGAVEVTVRGPAVAAVESHRPALTGPATVPSGEGRAEGADRVWTFPLDAAPGLPDGAYEVRISGDGRRRQRLRAGRDLVETLPAEALTRAHRVRVSLTGGGGLRVTLRPPLADDEVGEWAQAELTREAAAGEVAPAEAVLFQADGGLTGNQRAVLAGLRSLRPDLARWVAVPGTATPVPPGAVGVLIGTREYHRRLAAARYLCTDEATDLPLTKRSFQRWLVLDDGPASVPLTTRVPRFAGRSLARLELECEARRAAWDVLVAGDEAAAEAYRGDYGLTSQVRVTGHPRLDPAVEAGGREAGESLRRAAGAAPGQTLVWWSVVPAKTVDPVTGRTARTPDPSAVADRLGAGYLVVGPETAVRRAGGGPAGPVVAPAGTPLVGALIAADRAVLGADADPSDWTLLGRPVVVVAAGTSAKDLAEQLRRPSPAGRPAPTVDGQATRRVVDAFFV